LIIKWIALLSQKGAGVGETSGASHRKPPPPATTQNMCWKVLANDEIRMASSGLPGAAAKPVNDQSAKTRPPLMRRFFLLSEKSNPEFLHPVMRVDFR